MRHSGVTVVGAGLAGAEAAWQIASRGVRVDLYEMRPSRMTEAHVTPGFAELVCSNSFGSLSAYSASNLLKEELDKLGGFVLSVAREFEVPAGASLAVDRVKFSEKITNSLQSLPNVYVHREEIREVPASGVVVLATGPLTSSDLAASFCSLVGQDSLYFYDAISPIVLFDSLDTSQMFFGSRYGKGNPDFLNVPLSKEQYEELIYDLTHGEVVGAHPFEKEKYFESCMPIEVLASRGPKTLAFGPLKPVGLEVPQTGKRAYAVVQLRKENKFGTAYNLVGFQTKLKYGEQLRVFRKLPGFAEAEFLRLGSLHRNTFIDSPRLLAPTLQLRKEPRVFVAGQLTGTEGYLESSATGLLAGLNCVRLLEGQVPLRLPVDTMLGGLLGSITDREKKNFQPMNSNIGVLPPLENLPKTVKRDKQARNAAYTQRALDSLEGWLNENVRFQFRDYVQNEDRLKGDCTRQLRPE
ncbi:MAG: methylenetetrahydrofolate--tRNA-(uracil(54)-C(5))-methyltransferase (FADH(2)-oxidizing) TrmFO [Bdellovibrionales bacterium]|nr:methylenetetrahydrofolate--tRNA-(uracil(54)-C(5))-methyltransferase (FADH(2)-oxidizing) TrmFO [Bdellovibrionales bacterium]